MKDRNECLSGHDTSIESVHIFRRSRSLASPFSVGESSSRHLCAGHVGSGSVERVASAIGEGALSFQFVNE